jgi:hypothetical protein
MGARGWGALLLGGTLSLALAGCSESEAPDCGGLQVNDPWVRQAPSGADVMGAYFTLVNEGENKVVLHGVSSSQFDRAEMHETVVNDDGQASMQPMQRVAVPSGETVEFRSGGRHVMLFSPSQAYAAGDQVELILACGEQGAELPVAATVRAEQPGVPGSGDAGQSMDHGSMDHGGMENGEPASGEPGNSQQNAGDAMPANGAEGAADANEDSASAE